jgi:hypothetical protein
MRKFFIYIFSTIIIFGAPLLAEDVRRPLEEIQQLLERVKSEKGLKNIEKSSIREKIIQQLEGLISSNTIADKESLEKALEIAQNEAVNLGKTKPAAIKLTNTLKTLLAKLIEQERREADRLKYEQQSQKIREEYTQKLLSQKQENLKAFYDSVTSDNTHAILKWDFQYSNEDIASIVTFLKEHPDISHFTLDSQSYYYSDAIQPIMSQLSKQLISFTQIGGNFSPDMLKSFEKLKTYTLSRVWAARLSNLPQSIENLDLSNMTMPKAALEDIFSYKNLKTINLTNTKIVYDPGAEKDNIYLPISSAYIEQLKTELPGLVIMR